MSDSDGIRKKSWKVRVVGDQKPVLHRDFWVSVHLGFQVMTNGKMFLNVFGLFCFDISNRYLMMRIRLQLLLKKQALVGSCARIGGRDLKSPLFDSKLSLIEFVRNKRSVSPFMGPYRYPVYYELLKTITATKRHQKVSIYLTLINLSVIIPPIYLRFWAVMWSRYQVETAMNWERIRENKLNIVSSNFFILRHCRLNRGHQ